MNISNNSNQLKQTEFDLLDHGKLKFIGSFGNDDFIAESARVSYGEGTKKVNDNKGLIRYLMSHNHTSPFEQPVLYFYVKLPIPISRQWMRHRTGTYSSMNEISARYSEIKDEFYQPNEYRIQSKTNKQSSIGILDKFKTEKLISAKSKVRRYVYKIYRYMLGLGVAREQARMDLPQGTYTEFQWRIDLHNLLHFLALRLKPDAQMEIRVYAEKIEEIVKQLFPVTYEAFEDYKLNSMNFSRIEQGIIRKEIEIETLNEREKKEFLFKIEYLGLDKFLSF